MSTAADRLWMERYNRLLAFHKENGHCNVPNTYKNDQQLSKWVKKQRYNQIAGKLRKDRKILLETIGFAWSKSDNATFDQQWMEVYHLLVAFKKRHGHTRVTVTGVQEHEKQLATWVMNQRALQRSGELRKDRKRLLDQIGFIWRTGNQYSKITPPAIFDQRWMDRYNDLVAFKKEKGHCAVPFTYPEDPQLAIWVLNQRKFQRAGQLRKDRYDLLDQVGFIWRNAPPPTTVEQSTATIEDETSSKKINSNNQNDEEEESIDATAASAKCLDKAQHEAKNIETWEV